MKWIIKNIGLTAIACAIVFCTAIITMHLQKIEDDLDSALRLETSLAQLNVALSPVNLEAPIEEVVKKPMKKLKAIPLTKQVLAQK